MNREGGLFLKASVNNKGRLWEQMIVAPRYFIFLLTKNYSSDICLIIVQQLSDCLLYTSVEPHSDVLYLEIVSIFDINV